MCSGFFLGAGFNNGSYLQFWKNAVYFACANHKGSDGKTQGFFGENKNTNGVLFGLRKKQQRFLESRNVPFVGREKLIRSLKAYIGS